MRKPTHRMAMTLMLFCVPLLAKATLPNPGCSALDSWVSSDDRNEKFEVHPDVRISTLFKNENLLPLFDKSVTEWERKDYGALGNQLVKCRKEAKTSKNTSLVKDYTALMLTMRSYSRGRG